MAAPAARALEVDITGLEPVPFGFCHCRCGQRAPIAPANYAARGWVKGEPQKYVHGHRARLPHAAGPRRESKPRR